MLVATLNDFISFAIKVNTSNNNNFNFNQQLVIVAKNVIEKFESINSALQGSIGEVKFC